MKRKIASDHIDVNTERRVNHKEAPQSQSQKTPNREEYTVGWICALTIELAAAQLMRDEEHGQIDMVEGDTNVYVLGRIAAHSVVMTCLPQGSVGTNAAATAATNMTRSFPQLRFILLVGVGAGVPDVDNTDAESDIRLGDVVVSKPSMRNGGVIQYDFGKTLQSGIFDNGKSLNKPPPILRAAVSRLEASHIVKGNMINDILQAIYQDSPRIKKTFQHPGGKKDVLFRADYEHTVGQADCSSCQSHQVIPRQPRDDCTPVIHYGLIASANRVMRDALTRDKMRKDLGVKCFEMEAAGMMDDCPCLVVRGICDYADSHKNDRWQPYAALTAAAYAKELLQSTEASSVRRESVVQLADILQEQAKATQEQIQVTLEHHQEQAARYRNEKDHACHRVFKTSGSYLGQKNINPDAVLGTCRWVLDHPQYQSWIDSTKNDLLWISADPGCGKSVLSKSLIDVHLPRSSDSQPHTICYYFFKDDEQQNGLSTALCAILHQLFSHQPRLIRHAVPAFEKNGDKLQCDTYELWRIIQNIANDATASPITCILDALDECQEVDRTQLIDLLCEYFSGSRVKASKNSPFKWLVTSRPYDNVRDRFKRVPPELPSIRLRGEDKSEQIRDEINLVIRQRVRELSEDLTLSTTKTEEISQKLLGMEHRTYLWLYLAIDAIRDSFRDTIRPRDHEIVLVPATVEEAYERILARVTQRKYAMTVLTIIIGARRPLTIEEMALALDVATLPTAPNTTADLKIDAGQLGNKIRRWCGLFVLISGDRLYLLHQTAKEFLLNHNDELPLSSTGWKHCLSLLDVEKEMATICILYLCLSDFNDQQSWDTVQEKERPGVQTFFRFAAEHWASHTQLIESRLDKETHANIQALYDTSSERWRRWTSIAWRTTQYRNSKFRMNRVQLAAFNGHYLLLQNLLKASPEGVNSRDIHNPTGLILASERGFPKAVQTLLNAGADVTAQGGFYGNALQAASAGGHVEVVQILLNAGAEVNAQGGEYGNALQAASARGHVEVVQILLNVGAEVNAQSGYYGNALQAASARGHVKVVQTLLNTDAQINAQGGYYGNALQAASAGGHSEVVQILLIVGAEVNAQGGEYGNALQAASARGHVEVVQILLNVGAEVNAQGGYYGNALQAASARGHVEVVQTLLIMGAEVNAQGGDYGNALQVASVGGHSKVIQILLSAGAEVNAQGGIYSNALRAASAEGHLEVVQALLNAGAEINVQDDEYGDTLQAALAGGHADVVQILLSVGAEVNAQGGVFSDSL